MLFQAVEDDITSNVDKYNQDPRLFGTKTRNILGLPVCPGIHNCLKDLKIRAVGKVCNNKLKKVNKVKELNQLLMLLLLVADIEKAASPIEREVYKGFVLHYYRAAINFICI